MRVAVIGAAVDDWRTRLPGGHTREERFTPFRREKPPPMRSRYSAVRSTLQWRILCVIYGFKPEIDPTKAALRA
jgi:hypothetical protein